MRTIRTFLAFLVLILSLRLMATELPLATVSKQPVPEWVKKITPNLPENIPVKDVSDGTYYLLADSQNKLTEDNAVAFRHYAELIINQKGVQRSGQVGVTFDPIYESVAFHQVNIIRDGVVIDKLATSDIKVINVEPEFDELIYNGSQSAKIIIDDVRVNDVLEYSYSRKGRNPVYKGLYSYRPYVSWSVPLHHQSVRVLWGKKTPLYVSSSNDELTIENSEIMDDYGQSFTLYEFERFDGQYKDFNSQSPNWFDPYEQLFFTQSKSWAEIVDWALPMYEAAFENGDNAAFNQVVLDLKLTFDSPQQQVAAALKIVQDDVRYFGIEMGRNSHQPSFASETLERRYGDCKDKVVLFVSLLNALDIEAYPALVNTDDGRRLLDIPAGVGSFDHVIAQVVIGDQHFWFDPTLSFQAGQIDDIYQPNYDVALLIKPGADALISMNDSQRKVGEFVHETFDITAGGGKPATLTVVSHYLGNIADRNRRRIAEDGLADLEKDYLNFYRDYYQQTETLSPMQHEQDPVTGQINLTEHYQLNDFWQDEGKGRFDGEFYAHSIRGYLKKPSQLKRNSPYRLSHPVNVKQTVTLLIGEDGWEFDDESLQQDNKFYYFSYQLNYDETARKLTIEYHYRSKVDFVSIADFDDYNNARKLARKETYYSVSDYITTTPSSAVTSQSIEPDTLGWLIVVILYFVGYGMITMAWLIDGSELDRKSAARFYPVSFTKVLILSVLTFGLYPSYWAYRQWEAIKRETNESITPFWRAVFMVVWFIPLWIRLRRMHDKRLLLKSPLLLSLPIAIGMFGLFLAANVLSYYDEYFLMTPVVFALALWPMLHVIIDDNKAYKEEIVFNNRLLPRHLALVGLFVPLVVFVAAQWSNFIPAQRVVQSDAMWPKDIQFMRRNDVLAGDEIPQLFYSNATIDLSEDGNGFTNKHVFSYWRDASKTFNIERATFDEIKSIDFKAGSELVAATITVTRNDDTSFDLYVPSIEGDDKHFYQTLNELWLAKQPANK